MCTNLLLSVYWLIDLLIHCLKIFINIFFIDTELFKITTYSLSQVKVQIFFKSYQILLFLIDTYMLLLCWFNDNFASTAFNINCGFNYNVLRLKILCKYQAFVKLAYTLMSFNCSISGGIHFSIVCFNCE